MDRTNSEPRGYVRYVTLGCKLNFSETSTIGRQLGILGYAKAADDKGAQVDLCVVNTCTVTEASEKKCRQTIRKLIRTYPTAKMVVTGCYAQLQADALAAIEGVSLVLGNDQKGEADIHIAKLMGITEELDEAKRNVPPTPQLCAFTHSYSSENDRTRCFLKVQDGCNYFCAYCAVPYARGRSRNGSIAELTVEAQKAIDQGAREIILSGINIGDFGRSTGENLLQLLHALDELQGDYHVRISSVEPNLLKDEIIAFVATSHHMMPHFHIPLQSGSDKVLRLMRRRYNTALFANRIATIKRIMPHAFIGVDVIVGMNGETEEYFQETLQFLTTQPVSQLHVFSYSERYDTDAVRYTPRVTPDQKSTRSNALLALSRQKTLAFYRSQEGKTMNVLFEHAQPGHPIQGYSNNYIRVIAPYDEKLTNQFRTTKLGTLDEEKLAFSPA